jgi:hypothetical protein
MYRIVASVFRGNGGDRAAKQVPTFFLDEREQGITSAHHAQQIALEIIDPWGEGQVIVDAIWENH